jgi:hypothetical protein
LIILRINITFFQLIKLVLDYFYYEPPDRNEKPELKFIDESQFDLQAQKKKFEIKKPYTNLHLTGNDIDTKNNIDTDYNDLKDLKFLLRPPDSDFFQALCVEG